MGAGFHDEDAARVIGCSEEFIHAGSRVQRRVDLQLFPIVSFAERLDEPDGLALPKRQSEGVLWINQAGGILSGRRHRLRHGPSLPEPPDRSRSLLIRRSPTVGPHGATTIRDGIRTQTVSLVLRNEPARRRRDSVVPPNDGGTRWTSL